MTPALAVAVTGPAAPSATRQAQCPAAHELAATLSTRFGVRTSVTTEPTVKDQDDLIVIAPAGCDEVTQ